MTYQEIAKVAHEINKAYCSSIGDGMHDYYKGGFEEGAKWMRYKILNK